MITKLDFVAVPSLDAERSRSFYVDTLGLRPDDSARFEFWAGETCFGIWEPDKLGGSFAPQKNGHLALHVDDVATARGELEAQGRRVHGRHVGHRRLPHGLLHRPGRQRPHAAPPIRATQLSAAAAAGPDTRGQWVHVRSVSRIAAICLLLLVFPASAAGGRRGRPVVRQRRRRGVRAATVLGPVRGGARCAGAHPGRSDARGRLAPAHARGRAEAASGRIARPVVRQRRRRDDRSATAVSDLEPLGDGARLTGAGGHHRTGRRRYSGGRPGAPGRDARRSVCERRNPGRAGRLRRPARVLVVHRARRHEHRRGRRGLGRPTPLRGGRGLDRGDRAHRRQRGPGPGVCERRLSRCRFRAPRSRAPTQSRWTTAAGSCSESRIGSLPDSARCRRRSCASALRAAWTRPSEGARSRSDPGRAGLRPSA